MTAAGLSEGEVARDIPSFAETRIGLSASSATTRTEPLDTVSLASHRAYASRWPKLASGSSSPSIDEPLAVYAGGALNYLNVDGLGSVVATNNPAGGATSGLIYDAWGVQKVASPTRLHPFDFTGREVGEGGLLFYRARQYQPLTGRFTSRDPLRFADGPSLYRYVRSSPLSSIDPLGLLTVYVWKFRGSGPNDAWGHASMTLDDGTHISWWPSGRDRQGLLYPAVPKYDAPPKDDQTLARDVEDEGADTPSGEYYPDYIFTIRGLDEKAIREWWDVFRLNNRWKTFSLNCSTVVANALRAGGAYVPLNFVWTPEDVRMLAQALKAQQQQRSGTPARAPSTALPPPVGWSLQ